jgi:hypothetical protein
LALIIKALLKEISRIGKIQKAKEAIDNYILHCPYFTREFKENLDTRYEDNFDEYFKDIIEIATNTRKGLKGHTTKDSIKNLCARTIYSLMTIVKNQQTITQHGIVSRDINLGIYFPGVF